jgi:restriction system protein
MGSYLPKKYGLLDNSERGIWSLTERGRNTRQVDPQEVVRTVRATSQDADTPVEADEQQRVDDTPQPMAASESWRDRLLQTLFEMPPASFERLCMRLLREAGFIQVEVTGRSGDGGIDGYGVVRMAGLLSFRVAFQSKRHRDNVSSPTIRDFRGAMMGRAEKGLLITTANFTRDAQAEANRDGATAIDLIDGDLLVDKLKELRLGVRTELVEAVTVDQEWFRNV